jgi:hypothetical protein
MKTTNRPLNRREQLAKPLRAPGMLISRTTRGVSYKPFRSVYAANANNQPPRWG